jgi:Carboxypeptidase regulatory-like domain
MALTVAKNFLSKNCGSDERTPARAGIRRTWTTVPVMRLWIIASVLMAGFFGMTTASAQMDQGAIAGVTQDNTGAAIPNAAITLMNLGTGLTLTTTSDTRGEYLFPTVKIGDYKVSASAPGFQTSVQEHIHVDVQGRPNIVLTLQAGSVSQTITVTEAPPLLQTQESSVGQVMSTQTINDTPLNGRNWVYIAHLAAGVAPSNGARGNGKGDFNANGQRAEQNNFILDGIDNNYTAPGYLSGSSYVVQPPPDALGEFKIQTSDYSAEFGHSGGAVVNATTASGTNSIHGDLWEYFRNDVLDARDFNALTIPKYRENQFGATLGMPIIKQKLFFFGYAEDNRIIFGSTLTESIPTAKMRTGDFSELLNPSLTATGAAIPIYQPGSAGTVQLSCNGALNVICPAQIDGPAQGLLKLYPSPNTNGGKLFNNYTQNLNDIDNTWQWGTRVDWNISTKDQVFGRFSYTNERAFYASPLGQTLDGGAFGTDGRKINFGENFAGSETHIFTPTLTNEFRFGYNYGEFRLLEANSDTNISSQLGFGGIPYQSGTGGLPAISLGQLSAVGTPGFLPNQNIADDYQILDNVIKVFHGHSIKMGVDFESIRSISLVPPAARGTYTFDGFFTSKPGAANTGFGAADFLLNQMNGATLSNANLYHNSHWYRAAFVQDDWTVTQKLTLNLGLRYEFFQPDKEINGRQASFLVTGPLNPGSSTATLTYTSGFQGQTLIPAITNYLTANNVSVAYSSNPSLANAQKENFSPRVGFALSVTPETVVRGGFGIFFGGLESIGGPGFLENYPFQFTSSFPRPGTCTAGNCPANGISVDTGFQAQISGGLANFVSQPAFVGIDANVKTPYSEGYNLTVERSINGNTVASVGYVGAVNRHLQISPNVNSAAALTDPRLSANLVKPFPTLGGITQDTFVGTANYNSLQTRLERRLASGLSFLATYTYSHSLDDARPPLGSNGVNGFRAPAIVGYALDYSNSSWDIRHRVTLNGYYQLPFGRGHAFANKSRFLDEAIGQWAADLQFTAQTGYPFTVGTNLGSAGPNGATAEAIRVRDPFAPGGTPDPSNPNITCAQQTRTKQHWYNPCSFANPPLAFPNASVAGSPVSTTKITGLAALPYLGARQADVEGPGYERVNLSLFKRFATIREQYLEFRADIFNVFNTPAYGIPSISDDSTNGGQITAPHVFQNITPDARFIQLSAKYSF